MSCGTNTVTQESAPPASVLAAYQNVNNTAQQVASTPYQPYSGATVAGFTPDQLAAFQSIEGAQGLSTPFTNAGSSALGTGTQSIANQTPLLSNSALGSLAGSALNTYTGATPNYLQTAESAAPSIYGVTGGQGLPSGTIGGVSAGTQGTGAISNAAAGLVPAVNASTISQYENPYTSSVVNATEAQLQNQDAQQQTALQGNAISAGAWGGDRAGVAAAQLGGQQALANNSTIAGLESSGYTQALAAAQNQQQVGLSEANLGLGQENVGIGQQNANTSLLGTSGNLGLGQENYGLSGLNTGINAGEAQENAALTSASGALSGYQNQAGLAEQAAATTGGLNVSAGADYGNLGVNAENEALQGASTQLQSGALQQQLAQEELNVPLQNYETAQQYPFNTTQFEAGIAEGTGALSGGSSESTSPGANVASQLGGLGLTGLGLYNSGLLGSAAASTGALDTATAGVDAALASSPDWASLAGLFAARGGRIGLAGGGAPGGVGVGGGGVGFHGPLFRAAAANLPRSTPQIPIGSGTPGSALSINPVSNYTAPPLGTAQPGVSLPPGLTPTSFYTAPPFSSYAPQTGRPGYDDGGDVDQDAVDADESGIFESQFSPGNLMLALNDPVSRTGRVGIPRAPLPPSQNGAGVQAPPINAVGDVNPFAPPAAPTGNAPAPSEESGASLGGDANTALLATGLALAAGTSHDPLTNIGKAGLEGLQTYESEKSNEAKRAATQQDQSLKNFNAQNEAARIQAEIQNYKNTDARDQKRLEQDAEGTWSARGDVDQDGNQILVNNRTGATMAGSKVGENPAMAQQRSIEQQRADAETSLADQGRYQWTPGTGPDPNDSTKQVQGTWRNPTRGDEDPKFYAGQVETGRNGAGGAGSAGAWKYNTWLAAHPGDTDGALDYAGGHRSMTGADALKAGYMQARAENSATPGLYATPADIDNRAQAVAKAITNAAPAAQTPNAAAQGKLPAGVTSAQAKTQAQAAIARNPGARQKVIQRLQSWGVDASGL